VKFQWVGAKVVKMWTDADLDPEFEATVAPDHETRVILAKYETAGTAPDPVVAASVTAARDPRFVPIFVRFDKAGPAVPVPKSSRHLYVGKDDPTGSTFLLDLSNQKLVDHGGRAEVIFRNVRCPNNDRRTVHVADAVVLEQHHIAIDVGASFSLDRGGSLNAHPEFSLNAYSRWSGSLSGAVDLRLTTLEQVAKDSSTDQPSFLASGGNTLDGSGRLFVNLDPDFDLDLLHGPNLARQGTQPWFAIVGGAGVRSVPRDTSTEDVSVDVRARFFGGLRAQVLGYNSDLPAASFGESRGHLEVGVAKDQFWRDTTEERLYAEAQLEIPDFGGKYVRFLARVAVDRPMDFGDTSASEVRLSVLSSINPALFGQLLGFSQKAPTP
jgi:hypothetical protein